MTALAALDAPHAALYDEALTEQSESTLDDFLAKLGALPSEDLDSEARRLMDAVKERLEAWDNPISRAVAAQSLLGAIDARAGREREVRDIHVGIMIWPWHVIQSGYKRELRALGARLAAVEITTEEYRSQRAAINDRRRDAERRATWAPKRTASWAHISRGLITSRVVPRMPHPLPDIALEEAERQAERAGRVVRYISGEVGKSTKGHTTLRDVVEGVRNAAIEVMLGSPTEQFERDGYPPQRGLGISNADVTRLLEMKTSRVSQIRTGKG